MGNWTDRFVGDRMTVDREFADRVASSEFSSQEWGTIMTAVEFEIERPETPNEAQLVANTEDVDQVIPALRDIQAELGGMGPGRPNDTDGGFLTSLKRTLGFDDDDSNDERRTAAAESLAQEYATAFQAHLEREGKWEEACEVASASD